MGGTQVRSPITQQWTRGCSYNRGSGHNSLTTSSVHGLVEIGAAEYIKPCYPSKSLLTPGIDSSIYFLRMMNLDDGKLWIRYKYVWRVRYDSTHALWFCRALWFAVGGTRDDASGRWNFAARLLKNCAVDVYVTTPPGTTLIQSTARQVLLKSILTNMLNPP